MSARVSRRDIPATLRVRPGSRVALRDANARASHGWTEEEADRALEENLRRLGELQYKLFADQRHAVLVVLQAIDGGGKDSTIRHVFRAFNPQGCHVIGFKVPNTEERAHDYLWRVHRHAPPRGEVTVFNRSHYEDVLVVRVLDLVDKAVWKKRYDHINDFERLLADCGTRIVKLFLQISRDEQKERFEERLAEPKKQWKFDPADLGKRARWNAYRRAYEDMLRRCSTDVAPWHVIPADRKWFRNFAVSQILLEAFEALPLRFPRAKPMPKGLRIV